jgi:hypothetical protein
MLDRLKKDVELAKIEEQTALKKLQIEPTKENSLLVEEARKKISVAKLAYEDEKNRVAEEESQKRAEEKEELTDMQKYEKYCDARDMYEQYKFGFLRRSGEFFITKVFCDRDKNDPELERYTTELENYNYPLLSKAFIELNHKVAVNYLRKMVEGKPFKIKNPEGVYEEWTGPRRIYHKLVNTIHIPDEDTYNVIDLTNIVKPTAREEVCPWILKCLFNSLGAGKQENIEWVEKWVYSVAVADIGNNQTPFPVFYGKGKMGKNALMELVIPAILGKELTFSGVWDIVGESGFTQFKLGKVVMFIDEIPERSEWTKIKNWTGSVTEYIKIKYGPEYTIDNVIALAFGSNETNFPLPFEDGEQMQRVSPLKAGTKTFAEYVIENAGIMFGREELEILVKDKIGYVPDTPHMLGDKFLRNFKPLWLGKDVIQQLVNYLHTKYGPEHDAQRFSLQPLRGEDWEELLASKTDYVKRTLQWALEKNTDYLIPQELYRVYEHMNKTNGKKHYKQHDAFYRQLGELLKEDGWVKNPKCAVDYANTTHQYFAGGAIDKTSQTKITVYFKSEDVKKGRVPSLLETYFKRVLINLKEELILNDE